MLVRGKGNLSVLPAAVEFELVSYRFEANGFEFNVPLAQDFSEGALTADDLIGDDSKKAEHSQVADASGIIEALLPRDGAWHPAKPIMDACSEQAVSDRTAQRAKARLRVEDRRTQTFPAAVEWRWPPTADTHTTCAETVATVATVATANGRNPLRSSSGDTHDSGDSEDKRRECGGTAELGESGADWQPATPEQEALVDRNADLLDGGAG